MTAECDAPVASVATVETAHGINANAVTCWRQYLIERLSSGDTSSWHLRSRRRRSSLRPSVVAGSRANCVAGFEGTGRDESRGPAKTSGMGAPILDVRSKTLEVSSSSSNGTVAGKRCARLVARGTGSAAACAVSALRRDNMESGGDMSNVLTW